MYGIAILDSGNFALKLCSILEKKGYVFEVVSTPCHIATNGCSYCIRFPMEHIDVIIDESMGNNIAVREIYRVVNQVTRNKYERIV